MIYSQTHKVKITSRSKGLTLGRKLRRRRKYKEKVPTERKGGLGSEQRRSWDNEPGKATGGVCNETRRKSKRRGRRRN